MKPIHGLHWIGNRSEEGRGNPFSSHDPATGAVIWNGNSATATEVEAAVKAAKSAFPDWSNRSVEDRFTVTKQFAEKLEAQRDELAQLISLEVGKPLWESHTEVSSMIAKVEISAEAHRERCSESSRPLGEAVSRTRFRPHGAVAVFGPFNFPGHISNGHIVPALLAGNTIIFKPSEQAPATAQRTVEIWRETDLPDGVLNLLHGGSETGRALSAHPDLDGLFFTGSHQTGLALNRQFADHPEKILALEMGGNNPLLVFEPDDPEAAALLTIQSAFLTAGQRCTCARRLIVPENSETEPFLQALLDLMARIRVGRFTDNPEPFMGPLISTKAADQVLEAQENLLKNGARPLFPCQRISINGAFLTPGLIDVTDVRERKDREIFGPLLQLVRVRDFDAGLAEANATRFGLAAGLVSRRKDLWEQFFRETRAGVVNWNQQLTGASSRAPFGGLGASGNHRPSGFFAADYCSTPSATIERETLSPPEKLPEGIDPQPES